MRRLLVTGFGPFPRVPRNPSGELARLIAADPRWRWRRVETRALVLDTAYSAIDGVLLPEIRAYAPDAVLMLGVATRRRRVTPEIRAVNRASRLYPDTSGVVASGRLHLERDAPLVRRTRAPVDVAVARLSARGVPAALSRDAGRYLCNAAYFAALGRARSGGGFACLFIHVPLPSMKAVRRHRTSSAAPAKAAPQGASLAVSLLDCATLLLSAYKSY